jgi:hypothetical protein
MRLSGVAEAEPFVSGEQHENTEKENFPFPQKRNGVG